MHPFLLPILLATLLLLLIKFMYSTLWMPLKIQHRFYSQGIKGPGYRPIFGNSPEIKREFERTYSGKPMELFSHDIVRRVDPCYHNWTAVYGKTHLFWHGSTPRLAISEPEMIKEVYMNKLGHVVKVKLPPLARELFAKGLLDLDGDKWAVHRKVCNPAFVVNRVKSWIPEVVDSVEKVMKKWEEDGSKECIEVDVLKVSHFLAAEILSKTAFGSNFEGGKRIFELQDQQATLAMEALRAVYIPGLRFLPTRENRMRWAIKKEIRGQIRRLIERETKGGNSKCLLSFLLNGGLPMEEVIDECQTFYFAGKEAAALCFTWALLLLAMHPEWQTMAREEVFRVCKNDDGVPNADTLNDLKLVNLILNEALRLYPPIPSLFKQASKDMKLGNLDIPAGTEFYFPVASVHHDPEIWGADANEFNPRRFNEPRKHLASFFPFSLGSTICMGQNFAMMEGKIILTMILKRFSFELSPSYVHSPVTFLGVTPQFGAQILFRSIN